MTDPPIPRRTWRLALVIASCAFMSGLDASVVNVGLDTIGRDLAASLDQAQWVTNAYLIAMAVSLPACGWLGRRVGVGRLWLAALAGFTATSALCAMVTGIGWLIAMRVLQGMTAGLLIPAGQTILGQAVGPRRLGRVMATLGIAVTLAPAVGPTVGGLLVHVASWPWLFLVNVPLGVAGLLIGRRLVPRGEPERVGRLDWPGLLLVTAGLPLLAYGLTAWGERGHLVSPTVGLPIALGLGALAAFVRRSRTTPWPVLDLRLFRDRLYTAAIVTTAFTGAAMFGAGLLFPLYFQVGRGESPVTAGLLLISLSVGTALVLPISGRLTDRYGGGVVSASGALGTLVTTVPFAILDIAAHELLVQALLLARGMALALAVVPASTAAYQAVSVAQLPDATVGVNIMHRVGGALGGAIFAVVLAGGLPAGVQPAFHTSFWWLVGASALALASASWLAVTERRGSGPESRPRTEVSTNPQKAPA